MDIAPAHDEVIRDEDRRPMRRGDDRRSDRSRDGDDSAETPGDRGARDGDEREDQRGGKPRGSMSPLKRGLIGLTVLVVLGGLATGGYLYWQTARHYETTDDAAVDGHIAQVSSQVAGRVITLDISDNQPVVAGQVLLRIDPRDYQIKVDQARANRAQGAAMLAQARAQVALQQASVEQAAAQVRVNEADLSQAQQDNARYRSVSAGAITRQQLDNSSATLRSAQAKLDAQRQALAGARAQLDANRAMADAQAAALTAEDVAVANADLQLSYTTLTAPQSGRVTRRQVEVGNYVNPGQALLSIVPAESWITANFKETQLADMRVGQPAEIRIDAFPGKTFKGHVDSFQSGTGSVFSALPAENATGNFVKVVQRVPVKIVFDDAASTDPRIAPGLSANPRVRVR